MTDSPEQKMATKVCHLTNVHSLYDQRVFYKEARSLAMAGYDVTLVGPGFDEEGGCREGVRVVPVPVPRSLLGRMMGLWRVMRAALSTGARLYHLHDPELLPVGVMLRVLRKRVIYDCHEHFSQTAHVRRWVPGILSGPLAFLLDRGEPLLAGWLDGVIGVVEEQHDRFRRVPFETVRNYPRLELFPYREIQATNSDRWLLHVGTLSRARGSLFLLEMMQHLRRTHPQARLRLIGRYHGAEERTDFLRELERSGLQDVVDCRPDGVPHDRLAQMIRTHETGLLPTQPPPPSMMPWLPTKLFEYLACGLPVVASALPAIRQAQGAHEWGSLVEPGEAEAYAAAIGHLLDHPEMAIEKGKRGRQLVEMQFNWQVEADRLTAFYERILQSSAKDQSLS